MDNSLMQMFISYRVNRNDQIYLEVNRVSVTVDDFIKFLKVEDYEKITKRIMTLGVMINKETILAYLSGIADLYYSLAKPNRVAARQTAC